MHEPDFGVAGETAIVTGASRGIGRSIAETLAAGGANVAICSRSMDRIGPVADAIDESEADGSALAVECDVRDRDAVEDLVDETVEAFGDIDVLVNNAGGEFVAPFEDISQNGWETILDLNLTSVVHCSHLAGAVMREGDGGAIVNLSSVNGQHAAPGESHYGAAKAAIIRLTETLAVEWAGDGVRVNCVAPGLIQTPGVAETYGIGDEAMPPREEADRRIGHPEEVADIVRFLVSPAASLINGETITAKGVPPAGNAMSSDDLGLDT
ncbi:SDR family NAD(P)-dependent oxidoreductase [Halovivax limisalsi]|uniref:SDR family NAD(P)-dependent oxidoreductase n=1 Tax=Halovivax limisalsi TaxID=1453760 RepID=UPI001FFCE8D5|nr:glucose 1-dehydrogenase [Halovivax limisalsi]